MKKRLSIGCAVANDPKILIMDEPSAALDIMCKETIAEYICSFKKSGGIVIMSTHDVGDLEICDRLYALKNGTMHPIGRCENVHELAGALV